MERRVALVRHLTRECLSSPNQPHPLIVLVVIALVGPLGGEKKGHMGKLRCPSSGFGGLPRRCREVGRSTERALEVSRTGDRFGSGAGRESSRGGESVLDYSCSLIPYLSLPHHSDFCYPDGRCVGGERRRGVVRACTPTRLSK